MGIKYIDEQAFKECGKISTIALPESLRSIGKSCFESCADLVHITIPENISVIPQSCFEKCYNLTLVRMSDNISYIRSRAFNDCLKLNYIQLSKNLKMIEQKVFNDNITIMFNNSEYLLDKRYFNEEQQLITALNITPDSDKNTIQRYTAQLLILYNFIDFENFAIEFPTLKNIKVDKPKGWNVWPFK
jgi:hypothetical protein